MSIKELARRLAKRGGTEIESERRALQRYLRAEVNPEPAKTEAIAAELKLDPARFVRAIELQVSVPELIADVAGRIDELAREFRASDAKLRGARAQSRVVDRLEALEAQVEESGKQTTSALRALAKEVRALSPGRAPAGQKPTPRRAQR